MNSTIFFTDFFINMNGNDNLERSSKIGLQFGDFFYSVLFILPICFLYLLSFQSIAFKNIFLLYAECKTDSIRILAELSKLCSLDWYDI